MKYITVVSVLSITLQFQKKKEGIDTRMRLPRGATLIKHSFLLGNKSQSTYSGRLPHL
jgi:hypothetical protein